VFKSCSFDVYAIFDDSWYLLRNVTCFRYIFSGTHIPRMIYKFVGNRSCLKWGLTSILIAVLRVFVRTLKTKKADGSCGGKMGHKFSDHSLASFHWVLTYQETQFGNFGVCFISFSSYFIRVLLELLYVRFTIYFLVCIARIQCIDNGYFRSSSAAARIHV
jgi:hypothetical protein